MIGNVADSYLEWMDSQDDFRRTLNRYLRSEWYKRRAR